ncbi:MAG: hypothetical protein M3Q65_10640 [Chloroflexota bacterium]|nr:hypothetical protein [Chloroflexota bacterium]
MVGRLRGGLQAYWDLAEPLPITGADDARRIGGLLWRLYARLGGLDAVQDLARVLRVPGTCNHKCDPPRPVTLLAAHPERRCGLAEFEALLPPPPPPASSRPKHVTISSACFSGQLWRYC